jgi:glycerol kinase
MQFQSDLLNVPVERPIVSETTALGAAYLAGLAVGFWKSRDDISTNWKVDQAFHGQMTNEKRNELYGGWKRAVKAAMAF